MSLKHYHLYGLLGFLFSFQILQAQQQPSYELAKTTAIEGSYSIALDLCDQLLELNPQYVDVINLKAWINSIQKKYDEAEALYEATIKLDHKNYDAFTGLINLQYWQENYRESLQLCNKALVFHPKDPNFYLIKIKLLEQLKDYDQANTLLQEYLNNNPKNEAVVQLQKRLKNQAATNSFAYRYINETYENFYNSTATHQLEYSKITTKGPVILRFNQAKRGDLKGQFLELETYPRLWKGAYSYLNLGVSNNVIYPTKRFGFDLYQSISKSIGFSIGARHLSFPTQAITLTKFSIEKYYRKYRLETSIYRTPSSYGISYNYLIHLRKYLKTSDDFLYLIWGKGINPDIQGRLNPQGNIYKLTTLQHILGFQTKIHNHLGLFAEMNFLENELSFDLDNYVKGTILNIGLRQFF